MRVRKLPGATVLNKDFKIGALLADIVFDHAIRSHTTTGAVGEVAMLSRSSTASCNVGRVRRWKEGSECSVAFALLCRSAIVSCTISHCAMLLLDVEDGVVSCRGSAKELVMIDGLR
jgi:hypothetical protein